MLGRRSGCAGRALPRRAGAGGARRGRRGIGTVAIIGVGDIGERLAYGLAASSAVERLVLVGRAGGKPGAIAATIASGFDCRAEPVELDASRTDDVATLLGRLRPDLVVQCASRQSPWALAGRESEEARGIAAGGLALRLPYQLPVVLSVMRAVRAAGYTGPVANVSFPDVTGPILERLGLAPTLGLGNVSMMELRARAALRSAGEGAPLVRVVGHHSQLPAVMQASEPAADDRCRVYVGDRDERRDELAYALPGMTPGLRYNVVTVASAVPVLESLLPGARPLRVSVPAPAGLPGGYPVRVTGGTVSLDLPLATTLADAVAFNERMAAGDGVERIDAAGTVHFSARARDAVAAFAPDLAEPLAVDGVEERATRLDALLV